MDRRLLTNYFYNILFQVVKIATPVIIVPYTMSHLGATTLGISDFAGNIVTWFILFGTLGANIYGNREIAKVRDDKKKLSQTFFEIWAMLSINMLIACLFYFLYIILTVKENAFVYYLYLFTILASALNITWFFYGVEDFRSVSIRNILVKIAGVILIVLVVKTPDDLWKFVLINSLSEVIGQGIMFMRMGKYISFEKISIRAAYRHHLKGTVALFIPTIASSVYTMLDQTMLGYLTDDTAYVATYKAAVGFINMFLYFITAIGSVMLPRITNVYYNHGGNEEIKGYISVTIKIAVGLALPMMFGMDAIASSFIPWYLPSQPEIATIIRFASPIILFTSLTNVFGTQYLVATGKTSKYTHSVVTGAIVNFIANSILIPHYQAIGAALGSVIAEFSVVLVQLHYTKDLQMKFDRSYRLYLVSAIIMAVVVYVMGIYMSASFTTNVIQVLVGVFIYVMILAIMKEELVIKTLKKVLRR